MSKVLVLGDTQHPFHHQDYLKFVLAIQKKYKCDTVVHVGDEVDFHALADFDADPDGMSAGDELRAAIESLKPYYKAFPKVLLCTSNHTDRIFKRAFKSGIPKAFLKTYSQFLEAPKGWVWADRHEVDGVVYQHGLGYSGVGGALNAAKDNMKPTVIGHLHADAGIQYWANDDKLLFGANAGCGINRKAYAFSYGKWMRRKPIVSCVVVLNGIPHLIPMIIGKNHRWTGAL